jgi:hypothetical protein
MLARMRLASGVVVVLMLFVARTALADDAGPAAPGPAAPGPPPASPATGPETTIGPPGQTPAVSRAADPPDVDALYQQALADFASARFDASANEFDEVGRRTTDPNRKLTAQEMGRQARQRAQTQPALTLHGDARLGDQSRDGRYALLVGTTVMGLSLYGPALPILANTHDSKSAVGLYMLGAGASFFVPYALTRDNAVTWGMTDAWWYGATRGSLHGLFAYYLLAGSPSSTDTQAVFGSLTLGSLAEGTAFAVWAQQTNASSGLTHTMGLGADFGTGYSLGVTSLVLPRSDLHATWGAAASLTGAGLGYVGGWWYGELRNPTWGDAEVMRAAGMLGAYTAVTPLLLGDVKDWQPYVGAAMLGSAAAFVVTDRLLVDHHFTAGQGIVTELSMVAGGLTGAGLGYLVAPSGDSSTTGKIVITGAVLGGAAGFAIAYLGLETTVRPAGASPITLQLTPDLTPGRRGVAIAGRF